MATRRDSWNGSAGRKPIGGCSGVREATRRLRPEDPRRELPARATMAPQDGFVAAGAAALQACAPRPGIADRCARPRPTTAGTPAAVKGAEVLVPHPSRPRLRQEPRSQPRLERRSSYRSRARRPSSLAPAPRRSPSPTASTPLPREATRATLTAGTARSTT